MIPKGYKQTEVGVIPEDWDIKQFSQLFTIGHGKNQKEIENKTGKYPILATSGVIGYTNSYLWDKPSALIGRKGTINKPQYIDIPFWTIDTLFFTKILDTAFPKYVYYLFCTVDWLSLNEASGVPSLSANNIEKINYAVPSFAEQQRIAEALSDVDSMIFSLEKLIAKKKAVKQGAMQEILTGKKRLPGFSRKWGKFKLGDLCCISGRIGFRGYTKDDLVNKGFGAITFSPSDIFEQKLDYSNCDYISFFKYDESPEIQVFNGDIIFCKTASIGKTALVKNLTEKATINPQFVLINKFKCNNEFLYYIISGKEFVEQILSITGGSTIPTISQEQLKMQLICMPELDEQNAIASILSDMDNEIEALKQKLEKTRQIKQGMMQQLLTGKIRLV